MNKQFFANLLPGTRLFSRFNLIRCISAGNFGAVYLCEDGRFNDRLMAIKITSVGHDKDDSLSEDLLRELRISRFINHQNVLRGEEFFRDDEFAAFTMEFVEGGSLADRLEARRPFHLVQVIKILNEICDGMTAIHRAGIVHRDLKPENILLTRNDCVRITDFGISSEPSSCLDSRTGLSGTLNYLSPEYVATGEYDIRSDIYAIGVIAYELATGKLPFSGKSLMEVLMSRVRFDPPAPHLGSAHVPRPLSFAILKAMDRSPNRRFQSLDELRDAFDFVKLPDGTPLWMLEQPAQ